MSEIFFAFIVAVLCFAASWIYERLSGDHSLRPVLVAVAAIVVIFGVYMTGAFDHALYHVRLNHEPCGRNLLTGAVFCGDELDQIRERRQELLRDLRR